MCYLTRIGDAETEISQCDSMSKCGNPRFRIRWFTSVAEVKICGHATLAAAHVLFTSGVVRSNVIEFLTLSGILTAKRIPGVEKSEAQMLSNGNAEERMFIELDLPLDEVIECDPIEIPSIPKTLNGAQMINIKKMSGTSDLMVELSSGDMVANLQPNFEEIKKSAGRGLLITGVASSGSGFDFVSRFFCPKLGVNEDQVCGSTHCALAPYWSKKLGKKNFIAYMASPRGGILDVYLDEESRRVLIRGQAVTVMEDSLLA